MIKKQHLCKKKSLKRLVFVLLALIFCVSVNSQTSSYSNEFLAIGVDAAAFGKSNSVVASTKNVNATYWNPAGLTNIKNKQIALLHSSYFGNIANYDFAAFAQPLDTQSALGISVVRFGVDDILDTRTLLNSQGDRSNPRPFRDLPRFSTADYAFTVSYARKLSEKNFSYGVNAKVVRRIIGDFASAWGFGLDAGIQGKIKKYTYGVMVRDITTTFNSWKIDDDIFDTESTDPNNALNRQDIPEKTEITIPSIQAGLARDFDLYRRDLILNAEINFNIRFAESRDLISTSNLSVDPAIGFDLGYRNTVFIRTGVGNFQRIQDFDQSTKLSFQPNFGVGFQYKGISVDYALTDIGDQSAVVYSNIFSIIVDWRVFGRR